MIKEFRDKVSNKLKEFGIEIYDEYTGEESGSEIIMAENLILTCDKEKEVYINFHVSSNSSYAARVMLILNEIEEVENFNIGDDFVINKEGKFLEGKEAEEYNHECRKKEFLNDLTEKQFYYNYLMTSKPFNC